MFGRHPRRHERFMETGRRNHSFQKGDLKYVILDLIKEKPCHGYEIIRAMEEASGGMYKPSPGTVYPTLQMLEDMGYADCNDMDGKKVYSITEKGEQFLVERKDLADGVRNNMKKRWSFKNIGRMAMVMKDIHEIEELLGKGFKDFDEDTTGKIREILARAYNEIEELL
ncbi:MAG: PadR family transcriptional regulator [Dehalococcoidales bacterium]|nr:PadR family transcriptional regulator [Dehalococcoidales bacterium]